MNISRSVLAEIRKDNPMLADHLSTPSVPAARALEVFGFLAMLSAIELGPQRAAVLDNDPIVDDDDTIDGEYTIIKGE